MRQVQPSPEFTTALQQLRERLDRGDPNVHSDFAVDELAESVSSKAEFIAFIALVANYHLAPGNLEYGEPHGYLNAVAAMMEAAGKQEEAPHAGLSPWAIIAISLYQALSYE